MNDWENFSTVFQRLEKFFYRNEDSFKGSTPFIRPEFVDELGIGILRDAYA